MTKEQVKFLDMLQNSKAKNVNDQKVMIMGKTPKIGNRIKPRKYNKNQTIAGKKGKARNKKKNYDESDEESNYEEEEAYQSDSTSV